MSALIVSFRGLDTLCPASVDGKLFRHKQRGGGFCQTTDGLCWWGLSQQCLMSQTLIIVHVFLQRTRTGAQFLWFLGPPSPPPACWHWTCVRSALLSVCSTSTAARTTGQSQSTSCIPRWVRTELCCCFTRSLRHRTHWSTAASTQLHTRSRGMSSYIEEQFTSKLGYLSY